MSVRKVGNDVFLLSVVALVVAVTGAPQAQTRPEAQRLGQVHLPISCTEAAQKHFDRAVALLHSFWYEKAAATFSEAAKQDPSCAMAYWGVAMSHYHPLWEPPNPVSLEAGRAAIEKAKALAPQTGRERDYIAALATFFQNFESVDHGSRVQAYEKAMEQLHRRYPADRETEIFHALSLLGTASASPPDENYTKQKQAGEILVALFKDQPEHPGLAHYIIHSYDYPELAPQALEAARRYANIAQDSPHALHMPSHIFTRLGLWEESILSNLDSAAAAHRHSLPGDELHALDYLMYAYLQRGQDRKARELLAELRENPEGISSYFAGLYASAAMPARYVLERHQQMEAALLQPPAGAFPGGRYAFTGAVFHFTRGLGAARTGDLAAARETVAQLEAARDAVKHAKGDYWAGVVEVQRQTVVAWLSLAEGKKEEALEQMRAAADREDALGKHPVTPGAVLPARELLGEMLLELEQPEPALEEFEAVLRASPNRFNALYGAARAAERGGKLKKARQFYAQLVKLAKAGDGKRPAVLEAQAFLAKE